MVNPWLARLPLHFYGTAACPETGMQTAKAPVAIPIKIAEYRNKKE